MLRRVLVLGSTGSVGRQALDVLAGLRDTHEVVGLSAARSTRLLSEQAQRFGPRAVALAEAAGTAELSLPAGCRVFSGAEGLVRLVEHVGADVVICGITGAAGLRSTLAAAESGAIVGLANKESLVLAGHLVAAACRRSGAQLVPVDSEHSALAQCLQGHDSAHVRRLILTASGGPFRGWSAERLAQATPAQALRHPSWEMGPRITVDSATLMNKALEIIEACRLFEVAPERVSVVVHPQSVVHSMVEYTDGALLAQLSPPDMRLPIRWALGYPARVPSGEPAIDVTKLSGLTFEAPDTEAFPCLLLGHRVARTGGLSGTILNAANEVAVEAFLAGRLPFTGIHGVVADALDRFENVADPDLETIEDTDRRVRRHAAARMAPRGELIMAGNLGSIVLAALGISFLIFIHELGHFLAARMFKVRVETFSLGFGPRIWGFRRGETDYRLSAVPLGGYVKMAGEYGDLRDSTVLAADDLTAKPAWQRAIIFSGGVIMNVIFAFLVFPLVFALGVPFPAPVIGGVQPGGPAWRAGLRQGDEVLTVDGHRVYQFADIGLNLALSDPEHVELRIRRGSEEQDLVLHGERNPSGELWRAGIGQLSEPLLAVEPDGPAVQAGLRERDELVAIDGVPLCATCTPDEALERAFEAGRPVRLTVRRAGQTQTVDATIAPARVVDEKDRLLGLIQADTTVLALRGPPEEFGYPLVVGDVILDVGGVPVSRSDKATEAISGGPPGEVQLRLRRDGRDQDLTLSAAERALFADGVALGPDKSTRIRVISESALAAAGVRDGDTIVALNGTPVHDYDDLHDRAKKEGPRLHVDWRLPSGNVRGADVETRPHVAWNYGLLTLVREVKHQESLAGSLRAGWDTSVNMLRTTWLQLEKLITGEVAAKNLGGIVQISYVTYQFASAGFSRLLFFLGLLSINLAVINVLPVPVLDGGQLLFLLLEKIRGQRLSERFLNAAQLAGLVAIVALVLYVTYHDISKMVG